MLARTTRRAAPSPVTVCLGFNNIATGVGSGNGVVGSDNIAIGTGAGNGIECRRHDRDRHRRSLPSRTTRQRLVLARLPTRTT